MNEKNKSNIFDIITYAMMIVAVIYIILQTFLGNNGELSFKLTLGIWILGAIMVNDFVEPMVSKVFDGITLKKGIFYVISAVCDGAVYVCLYIFIINIGFTKEIWHYLFLVPAPVFLAGKIFFGKMYRKAGETVTDLDDVEVDTLDDDEDLKVMIYRNRNK
ncbi:MAG: hypothetical protein ACI4EN_06295 [Butyrivibrio sp.]